MCQILFTSFTKEKYLDKYLKKYFAKLCQPDYWCSICLAPPPSLCVGILTWHCRYQQFIFVHHWTPHKYQYLRELSIKEHELTTLICSTVLLQRKPPLPRSSSVLHKARQWPVSEPSPAPRRGAAPVRQSAHRGNSRPAVLAPVTCPHTSTTSSAPVREAAPCARAHSSQMTIKMDGLTELPEIKSELNPDDFHSSVVSSNPQQQQQQQQPDTVNNCQQWVSWINPTSWAPNSFTS